MAFLKSNVTMPIPSDLIMSLLEACSMELWVKSPQYLH